MKNLSILLVALLSMGLFSCSQIDEQEVQKEIKSAGGSWYRLEYTAPGVDDCTRAGGRCCGQTDVIAFPDEHRKLRNQFIHLKKEMTTEGTGQEAFLDEFFQTEDWSILFPALTEVDEQIYLQNILNRDSKFFLFSNEDIKIDHLYLVDKNVELSNFEKEDIIRAYRLSYAE